LSAILRVAVLVVIYATALRSLAAAVGIWAGGALTPAASIFVGVIAPFWLFLFAPSWLAWRVVAPLGGRRARPLAAALCWLSPLIRARDLGSVKAYLQVADSGSFPAPHALPADAWTALAAALQADRRRSFARAARIVDALAHLPAGSRFPWLARLHGVEALITSAVERGDWSRAARYAELGRGRLARFVEIVREVQAGRPVPAAALWLRWAAAPLRRRGWPVVRLELARRRRAAAGAAVVAPPARALALADEAEARPVARAPLRHVRMLATAARHEPITTDELFALAAAWQEELDDAALAQLRARALELDVPDGAERARALRDAVVEELAELAEGASGEPPRLPGAGPLLAQLARRIRDRQLRRAEAALESLAPDPRAPAPGALELLERWLVVREALDDVERWAGPEALTALWYARARNAVWTWSCALFNDDRARFGWIAHMTFTWIADRAEILGDVAAMLVNRENARSALASAA
jgi:hypothetical protein